MQRQITLIGAYGRDYKSKKALIEDWEAGKDFQIYGGPYCSCKDIGHFKEQGVTYIRFRYLRLTRVHDIKI